MSLHGGEESPAGALLLLMIRPKSYITGMFAFGACGGSVALTGLNNNDRDLCGIYNMKTRRRVPQKELADSQCNSLSFPL